MTTALNNVLDVRLPQTPGSTDPALYQELSIIYNAIRQLQYGADQFLDIPPTVKTAPYTFDIGDRGRSIDTNANVTVPSDSLAAFPIGFTVCVTNVSTAAISVIPTVGVQLIKAGTVTTGTFTIANYGIATLRYLGSNVWLICGPGVA